MTQFITIAFLICHTSGAGKSLQYHCYEKGSKNLRAEDVLKKTSIEYNKCSAADDKSCDTTAWDGCSYKMKDETMVSGETCQ